MSILSQQTHKLRPSMVAGWLKTACWRWKMPPARPLTISTNLWTPAQVLKLSLRTPEALRWRHSSQGMNQSQLLLSCSLSITPLCSDQVTLLPHQRRALAWLLWRETQKPCGGILGKSTEQFGSLLPRNSIFVGGHLVCFSCINFTNCPGFLSKCSGWYGSRENPDHDFAHLDPEKKKKKGRRWGKGETAG